MRLLIFAATRISWIALSMAATSVAAQHRSPPPAEIGQIANEVLAALMPPERKVSRVEASKRGIRLDHVRTMEAFGYKSDAVVNVLYRELGVRSDVRSGSRDLLEDCRQFASLPCNKLGWSLYFYVSPVTMTDSAAIVRGTFLWPDRGFTAFKEGVVPTEKALLVGFSTEVHLAKRPDGKWKYVKLGVTQSGD